MFENLPTSSVILSPESWTYEGKVQYFKDLLRSTNREGIDKVLAVLDSSDFFKNPSSANNHSNYPGGLLDHTLTVYSMAMRFREAMVSMKPELAEKLPVESIIISSLLHDICKSSFYKATQKYRKNANGEWEIYLGYEIEDKFPVGHGEKSVIMLQACGLSLTIDEILAIRWHMGAWEGTPQSMNDKYSYGRAIEMSPLCSLIQIADQVASLHCEKEPAMYPFSGFAGFFQTPAQTTEQK